MVSGASDQMDVSRFDIGQTFLWDDGIMGRFAVDIYPFFGIIYDIFPCFIIILLVADDMIIIGFLPYFPMKGGKKPYIYIMNIMIGGYGLEMLHNGRDRNSRFVFPNGDNHVYMVRHYDISINMDIREFTNAF